MKVSDAVEILRREAALTLDAPGDLGAMDLEVASITEDSRRVTSGGLFVAVSGGGVDGHDFAGAAKQAGAVAILGEREGIASLEGVPYLHVTHARRALGLIAHELVGQPSHTMTVIGVTGTNGKSSTVSIIRQMLESFGHRCAEFGTLGYRILDTMHDAPHTTPFGEDLARLFDEAKRADCTHVVMEVSSHSLAQERVAGIDFDVAVFTNLTQDHLDFHDGIEGYRDVKLKLFERVAGPNAFTVVNADDEQSPSFIAASEMPCHTFGLSGECRISDVQAGPDTTRFAFASPWGDAEVSTHLLGHHNVMNIAAAMTTCCGLGLPVEWVADHVAKLEPVPGRFEHIATGQDFRVVVDYAHTDDGLRNILRGIREITDGRIIALFGCGGDRDRGKRARMAAAVAEAADFAVITSDNPRSEDPARILLDVEAGMQHAGKKKNIDYIVVEDRREAIAEAIGRARPGDVVLLAGKGHENYQIIGSERIPLDDREVAREVLQGLAQRGER
ncbi:MAG: UDP-N-acetylmuramoyl-L-alanyl-D-glutamate--2,6-diaminopimelate ligase [Candidatus Hydrogenedentes bacterium]|nr:UDP-N-acetylmuramoyl-L-alanyl-D-glutamate--2,6-diaminopimelate ligase [Candidatus Hydrogenedentota bacterium]